MLQRLVPSMLLLAGGFGSFLPPPLKNAISHFETVRELVESGLPAGGASTASFQQATTRIPSGLNRGFALLTPTFIARWCQGDLAAQLEAEYKTLSQSLEGAKDTLPPAVKSLIESADGSDLRRYVNLILKEMNPGAPPPLVKFSERSSVEFESRLNRLMEAAAKVSMKPWPLSKLTGRRTGRLGKT